MSPNLRIATAAGTALAFAGTLVLAQPAPLGLPPGSPGPPPTSPIVTVSASATATIPNDRLHTWLRAESENTSAATAASEINTRMARALARIKAVPGVTAQTSGYGTNQVVEKGKPARWRVVQTVKLEGADFAAIAALVAKLQEEDGLLLSGLNFSVGDEARRKAEDAMTQAAIKAWQQRALNAMQGLGYSNWRPGRVNVQTGDAPRVFPMARGEVEYAAQAKAPIALEAGTTDITVAVSGEAVVK